MNGSRLHSCISPCTRLCRGFVPGNISASWSRAPAMAAASPRSARRAAYLPMANPVIRYCAPLLLRSSLNQNSGIRVSAQTMPWHLTGAIGLEKRRRSFVACPTPIALAASCLDSGNGGWNRKVAEGREESRRAGSGTVTTAHWATMTSSGDPSPPALPMDSLTSPSGSSHAMFRTTRPVTTFRLPPSFGEAYSNASNRTRKLAAGRQSPSPSSSVHMRSFLQHPL
mmetsp:Transcript_28575/g.83624  ORF Transcript_28575/g.83624 Transcript_28575/m.83624 type:complete len:226 (-) Transcript_28575:598-1275(-)